MEEILEPGRPICDPHHHLWDHPGRRYLLDELLADTGSGHHVVSTVFVECMSMYRAGGAPELRPVGETEFVNGVAAMSASGGVGGPRRARRDGGVCRLPPRRRGGRGPGRPPAARPPLPRLRHPP